nr:hypothetical protein KitaXyl93_41600 [Kitasatospora sp. Xyl93]
MGYRELALSHAMPFAEWWERFGSVREPGLGNPWRRPVTGEVGWADFPRREGFSAGAPGAWGTGRGASAHFR